MDSAPKGGAAELVGGGRQGIKLSSKSRGKLHDVTPAINHPNETLGAVVNELGP